MKERHIPVLLQEVIRELSPLKNQNFVDATVGLGGHTRALLEKTGPKGIVVGIDQDREALETTEAKLKTFGKRFRPFQGNFSEIDKATTGIVINGGILADLGVSSIQLDIADRGFSFKNQSTLDMRMDQSQPLTAEDVVNKYPESVLREIIKHNSDERFASKIAKEICQARLVKQIKTTSQLARIVEASIPKRFWPKNIHPATRTFQAIRMEVNQELQRLEEFLPKAIEIMFPGSRIAIITFHSREDYIVANYFKKEAAPCQCPPDFPKCVCGQKAKLKIINRKVIQATQAEIDYNPRSRSARLRVAEKI